MGLDVALVHRRRVVAPLDDERGVGETGLKIAVPHLNNGRQIRRRRRRLSEPGGHELLVDQVRAFRECRVEGQHRRKGLVLHLDEGQGREGLGSALRSDGGHGMAVVTHLASSNHVPREIGEVAAPFPAFDGASGHLGKSAPVTTAFTPGLRGPHPP